MADPEDQSEAKRRRIVGPVPDLPEITVTKPSMEESHTPVSTPQKQGSQSCPSSQGSQPDGPCFWDAEHLKLPFSPKYRYFQNGRSRSAWYLIADILAHECSNGTELAEAIDAMSPSIEKKRWDLCGLVHYVDHTLPDEDRKKFLTRTLPAMQRLALRLPELFPESVKMLSTGTQGAVRLTALQVACLLCHCFFCTVPYRFNRFKLVDQERDDPNYDSFDTRSYPAANFLSLFGTGNYSYRTSLEWGDDVSELSPLSEVQKAKLDCIFHYFTRFFDENGERPDISKPWNVIELLRKVVAEDELPEWSTLRSPLPQLVCFPNGSIEDSGAGVVQVDFANALIGGGVLGNGCVQEEIRFIISPELLVSRLLVERLDDTEAVEVNGTTRYSNYRGYGAEFRFAGSHEDTAPMVKVDLPSGEGFEMRLSRILAIDAVDFRSGRMLQSMQYERYWIDRELGKCYAGFHGLDFSYLATASRKPHEVATGNWGCGVFGGDVELKSLLQILAASAAGVGTLRYYAYQNAELCRNLETLLRELNEARCIAGDLYVCLLEYATALEKQQGIVAPDPSEVSREESKELAVDWAAIEIDGSPEAATEVAEGKCGTADSEAHQPVSAPYTVFTHVRAMLKRQ